MANFDVTAATAMLKELYDGQTVENLVYKNNPLLAMVPKETDFGGKNWPCPIVWATGQGRSAVFATAQTRQTAPEIDSFLITRKKDYSLASIDNELMEASATDKMSFLRGAKVNIDAAFRVITNSIASGLFRSGTGSIGQVNASGLSTGVITLMDPDSVVQFEKNMVIRCSNGTTDGNSVRAALGYVVAVDRTAGTVTVSDAALDGAAGTPSGWAASEYLSVDGDLNAKMSGLAAWLPTTTPSATLFYGVDRSQDTRLGGLRYNGSSKSIYEAIIHGAKLVGREGGSINVCVTNFTSYAALELELGAKVQYVDRKGPANLMFRGIKLTGFNSEFEIFPDRNCPGSLAYLLQMDTWTLKSLNAAPHILDGDGLQMLRQSTSDGYELRIGMYGNLGCRAPGWNCVVSLGA